MNHAMNPSSVAAIAHIEPTETATIHVGESGNVNVCRPRSHSSRTSFGASSRDSYSNSMRLGLYRNAFLPGYTMRQ